jgi:hypothetical protein
MHNDSLHWTQLIIHVNWFSLLKKDISTEKKISLGTIQFLPILHFNIKKTIKQMLMQSAEAIVCATIRI